MRTQRIGNVEVEQSVDEKDAAQDRITVRLYCTLCTAMDCFRWPTTSNALVVNRPQRVEDFAKEHERCAARS